MRRTFLCHLFASLFLVPTVSAVVFTQSKADDPVAVFWAELRQLCGKAFAGTVVAAPANDTTFKSKELVMHVRSCQDNRVKIPFFVGTDKSRTWVLTREKGRLLLKHDHRHRDGTPEKITQYGGRTTNHGFPNRQVFPADEETAEIVAAAAAGVWWIVLVPGEHFTYNFRDLGSDKYFSIRFDIAKEVSKPGLPWGWTD